MLRSLRSSCMRRVASLASTTTSAPVVGAASTERMVSWSAASSSSARSTPMVRNFFSASAPETPSEPAPSLVGGLRIGQLKEENKHINVVRYEHKNRTWTVHHVDYFSEAMAIGFLDAGFIPGDVVLSTMPEHWSETMVLQFACSKAGLVLYQLDASTAKSNPVGYNTALKEGLILSKANIFVTPETHEDQNYIELAQNVIPELTIFDTDEGQPFISPRYPHLRMCIHTGFDYDDRKAFYRIHHLLLPAGTVQEWLLKAELEPTTTKPMTPIAPSTPLMGQFELNEMGVPVSVGPSLTNEQVIEQKAWDTYCKILEKEFHDIKGVGVVF